MDPEKIFIAERLLFGDFIIKIAEPMLYVEVDVIVKLVNNFC